MPLIAADDQLLFRSARNTPVGLKDFQNSGQLWLLNALPTQAISDYLNRLAAVTARERES
jgi:hypothetical protein